MIFFLELFVAKGRFAPDELRDLAQRLTMNQLLTHVDALSDIVDPREAASADPGVMRLLDDSCHVVVHELDVWIVGGQALRSENPARYIARVYVPGPWRKNMSAFLIASITRVLSQFDPDPRRLYEKPHAEVSVLGVPEGGYGAFGRVIGESDVLDMISDAKSNRETATPTGELIDPVCGMLGAKGLTLEHEGTIYGFCSVGCRNHFAAKLAAEAS